MSLKGDSYEELWRIAELCWAKAVADRPTMANVVSRWQRLETTLDEWSGCPTYLPIVGLTYCSISTIEDVPGPEAHRLTAILRVVQCPGTSRRPGQLSLTLIFYMNLAASVTVQFYPKFIYNNVIQE